MILAFHNQDIEVKGILVFFMVFLYGLMIKIFQPYKIQKHNEIDLLATYCVGLSLVLGVFIYKNEFTPWVIFGLIIICNFLIIIINIIIIIIIIFSDFECWYNHIHRNTYSVKFLYVFRCQDKSVR